LTVWYPSEPPDWWRAVEDALAEDVGPGDVSGFVIPEELEVEWYIEAQQKGIVCGLGIVEYLLSTSLPEGEDASCEILVRDGSLVSSGQKVAKGSGPARKILMAERTALNFLTLLSGVSTLTHEYVKRVEGTHARIVDTRKTIPLLRSLQKYAVRCGGGFNHRMGLFDGAMLKDNHLQASKSIGAAIRTFRAHASHMTKLEIECEDLGQVDQAVQGGADVILLDNMSPFDMREAVKKHAGKCLFEASGGISLDTVRQVANTGVDLISVGALTHSAPAMAFHREFE
jgi:nicotinate-nucleotide pyrophosphorylase (carboxylating)